mgnify:CR=1 FL=1
MTTTRITPPDPPVWSGRTDGDTPEHLRWHQRARQGIAHEAAQQTPQNASRGDGQRGADQDTAAQTAPTAQTAQTPAVELIGFSCDEGVRRNKGRVGASEGPDALRGALAPLAMHTNFGIHDAGTMGAGDLDVLSDAITAVEAMGGTADAIVMDPLSWGQLRKLKTSTGSAQLLLGNPADQTDRRLFGVEVIVSANMPQGSALVIDSKNVLSSSGPITITQSGDFYFDRDAIAYRVTWRFGWTVVHPERLAKVAITLPSKG